VDVEHALLELGGQLGDVRRRRNLEAALEVPLEALVQAVGPDAVKIRGP
jgi:hypothetical protein